MCLSTEQLPVSDLTNVQCASYATIGNQTIPEKKKKKPLEF